MFSSDAQLTYLAPFMVFDVADHVTNYNPEDIAKLLPPVVSSLNTEILDRLGQNVLLPALAARLNVLAMLKRLLDLPTSASLQKRLGVIPSVLCITARNEDSSSALHLAAAAGLPKVARELLRYSEMDKLLEEESSSAAAAVAAAAGDGPRPRLLAECAAHGGNMELVRLFSRRTKDPRLRLLCAGLMPHTGGPHAIAIDQEAEEREGGGSSNLCEVARPLLATLRESCSLRGAFPCPSGRQSFFEIEVVSAGDSVSISLGFATDRWGGWAMAGEGDDTAWGVAGRTWKDGDVVGLGIDREKGQAYLSVNGKLERNEGTRLPEGLLRAGELRPAIAGRASSVRVNWGGSSPFAFNVRSFPSVWSHAQPTRK
jgi:hypothetical protein